MYCPKCGKELKTTEAKFCPECGQILGNIDVQSTSQNDGENPSSFRLRKAMFKICVLCAFIAVALPIYCFIADDGSWSGGARDWYYHIGIILTIILAVVAIIAGIIGNSSKK